MRKKLKNGGVLGFAENQTDMSPISLADLPYIEISGQNHIEIEGIYKIIECKENIIKLKFKKQTVSFDGVGLFMQNFSEKNAVIKGKINSVTFD